MAEETGMQETMARSISRRACAGPTSPKETETSKSGFTAGCSSTSATREAAGAADLSQRPDVDVSAPKPQQARDLHRRPGLALGEALQSPLQRVPGNIKVLFQVTDRGAIPVSGDVLDELLVSRRSHSRRVVKVARFIE